MTESKEFQMFHSWAWNCLNTEKEHNAGFLDGQHTYQPEMS